MDNILSVIVIVIWSALCVFIMAVAYLKAGKNKRDVKSWHEGYEAAWYSAEEYGVLTALIKLIKQGKITSKDAFDCYTELMKKEKEETEQETDETEVKSGEGDHQL